MFRMTDNCGILFSAILSSLYKLLKWCAIDGGGA
ncbi:hypothetical protein T01_9163 [Trichinella spiralis]|uniref:Uncharacterized protein n=1 Tax=Trichinella spiralis TaxID=6334 RepID=A0A0V1ANH0_TRISP|nr:hypothetical protein T01_9163 [Trichinella spiralis]